MPTPSLNEFARTIPVCEQSCGLAAVLETFRASGCNTIVVVSEQQRPIGAIELQQVVPYLSFPSSSGEMSKANAPAIDWHKPLSDLELPLIKPLVILPARLSLSQFWVYLQGWGGSEAQNQGSARSGEQLTPEHWGLVDEEGKFLGLLNSWQILKSLAQNFSETLAGTEAGEQQQQTSIKLLVQLLEQLPLPLSLQTNTGQVLSHNRTWHQQVGKSPDLDWVRRTTAALLDPLSVEQAALVPETARREPSYAASNEPAGLSQSLPTPDSRLHESRSALAEYSSLAAPHVTKSRDETSRAVQRHCAIDTPRMAATVSQRLAVLSAPSVVKTDEVSSSCWEAPAPPIETTTNNQERVFSFVKFPLSPSVVQEMTRVGEWENRQPLAPKVGANSFAAPAIPSSPHSRMASCYANTSDVWLVLAQDITEQQQVARELAAKNADLVQLNRMKDEFLACISHELKTPLTAVLGLSTLLKDQTLGQLNERQARYARLIYQSGRQLMAVVNDILDLTRIETGQLELSLEEVDLQTVCDRAYTQARQRPAEKDQTEASLLETKFTLQIEPGLEAIVADELRLRQMLMHLLSNALKFTDPGGEIGLKVNRWEGWIAFNVWDTGIGIPPEKQHLIFQKFQQLEHPLTRRFEGTGLGLVLTQRLAHLHGGDVSFISQPDKGSQFTLLLPPCPPQFVDREELEEELNVGRLNVEGFKPNFQPSHLQRSTQTNLQSSTFNLQPSNLQPSNLPCGEHPSTQTNRNRLVLVVETVSQYLEQLTEHLKTIGYRAVIARSGTEAIAKARCLQPCAVLLNPLLPQLSGWDVLTLLKSDAQTRHIPVLVTGTQAEKQLAYSHKADGFLNLPVQEQALLESLRRSTSKQPYSFSGSLTILHLSPVETSDRQPAGSVEHIDSSVLSSELTDCLSLEHSELNYRILEADDLEQAELLTRVWHPDVVLLDSVGITDPLAFLEEFSLRPGLNALPVVTLERRTTEAANQVSGLSVYPCLASDGSSMIAALVQAIQVAVGMSRKPSILVMDIEQQKNAGSEECHQSQIQGASFLGASLREPAPQNPGRYLSRYWDSEETSEPGSTEEETSDPDSVPLGYRAPKSGALLEDGGDRWSFSHGEDLRPRLRPATLTRPQIQNPKSSVAQSPKPHSSWIQALTHYLETAGFRTIVSCSWAEAHRQLQDGSVDLLLVRLTDCLDTPALVNGLVSLTQMPQRSPIFVLDHRSPSDRAGDLQAVAMPPGESLTPGDDSAVELESLLDTVATRIVRGSSQSMTQLLDQIDRTLAQK